MTTRATAITLSEAKDALLRSGYLLEQRLETILRHQGYYVETNSAYPDPDTGKSRELDLYALVARKAGPGDYDFVFPVLLIECVNNPQPLAFITKRPQASFLHHHDVKLAGLPAKMPDTSKSNYWQSLSDYLGMEKYHHYCKGRVATQFCSFVEKKRENPREWMATHDESHFDAFRKLSAVTEYNLRKHFESWTFGSRENVNIEFYYPLLVVQGELLEIQPGRNSLKITPVKHLQYRRSAIVEKEETTYQIDVITEGFFPNYIKLVGQEIARICRFLRKQHAPVRVAINRITRAAKRLRSPEKIRAAMDF